MIRGFRRRRIGPGYAHRYIDMVRATDIDVWLDTTVLAAEPGGVITSVSPHAGLTVVRYLGFDARSAYRTGQCFLIRALTEGRIRAVPGHRLWEG